MSELVLFKWILVVFLTEKKIQYSLRTVLILTTYHTTFSQYPHDSFLKCRHILGGRYDIECDAIDINMPAKHIDVH